ncbi:hypothetical protein G9O61_00g020240 [Vairimorpha ceranae]|nr:hypothetical protein G9O61_00g020240 [Vairimorpha ceranae]
MSLKNIKSSKTPQKIKKKNNHKVIKNEKDTNNSTLYTISMFLLDEISVRFLVNIDLYDLQKVERLFFILEEAHWFYIDNYNEPSTSFFDFCLQILNHNKINIDINLGLQIFKSYKQSIKVYGCIIFSPKLDSILVVQENGKNGSFGFPKGKKSKDEDGIECAIREVKEEIGYDVSNKIVKGLSVKLFEKMNFYFVFNVKKSNKFVCNLKNEIANIIWLPISKLEHNTLGKRFSIITKSFVVWKKIYIAIVDNKFKFDKCKFNQIIEEKLKLNVI